MRHSVLFALVLLGRTAAADEIEMPADDVRPAVKAAAAKRAAAKRNAQKPRPVLAPAKEDDPAPAKEEPPAPPAKHPAKRPPAKTVADDDDETPPGMPVPAAKAAPAAKPAPVAKTAHAAKPVPVAKSAVATVHIVKPAAEGADDAEPAEPVAKVAPAAKTEPVAKVAPAAKTEPAAKVAPATAKAVKTSAPIAKATPAQPSAAASEPGAATVDPTASGESTDTTEATTDVAPAPEAAPGEPPPAVDVVVEKPVHKGKWIEPYGAIAGGMRLESLHQEAAQQTGTQNPTVAVSRLGLRGGYGEHITFASEFEASLGGPLGYGSSVWEGQAAIAIRDQFVRYSRAGWSVAAGRIDDPASFDYVSHHVGDLLYTDLYTRDPLLYSGADRGNGLWGSYTLPGGHLTAGLTFHSTNPTGITGTLIIGGKLQPFDRPFYLAAAQVGNSQNSLPDQNLHIYFGSPSLMVHYDHFDAQAEVQMYSLDTQEAIMDDQTIRGYNFRLGGRAWTQTQAGKLGAFANISRNVNEILDPTTSKYRLPDLFHSYTLSGGADLDIHKKDGVGIEYAMVDTREPDRHTRQHYINIGGTYWIEDSLAIGLRAAVFAQQLSGEMMTTGSRSLFVTARLVLD